MLTNTDKFREAAIFFKEHGTYTLFPKTSKNYINFWKEEKRRCIEGYTAPDGDYITGYFYFYLNYCPIYIVIPKLDSKGKPLLNEKGEIVGDRIKSFPKFWDGDYDYFNYLDACEKNSQHGAVLKTRGRGYSFKGASMLNRNFFLIPGSKSYVIADQSSFLGGEDGILSKAWEQMSHINDHTAWAKKMEFHNTDDHKRASYKWTVNGVVQEKGYMSDIIGVTLKNDPQRARGKRGKLILFEEAGKFPSLLQAWQIARPSVEQGGVTFGMMVAFGCVCAGTKVWTKSGNLVNVEDLHKDSGILGFKDNEVVINEITHFNPPFKTECYKITTNTGRSLECSHDHPILYSTASMQERIGSRKENKYKKKAIYREASKIKIGDQVAVADTIEIFGTNTMWNPRLVGWLIGDGSYGKDKTPVLSNCEPEILKEVHSKFKTKVEKEYLTKTNKVYQEVRIKEICPELRALGIYGQTKNRKTLPNNVHTYSKKDLCELIGGIVDTDGYVIAKKEKCEVSITSSSKTLLAEILIVLNKLGIHGFILEIKKSTKLNSKDRNNYFRLVVGDKASLLKFSKLITLYPKVKRERVALFESLLESKICRSSNFFKTVRFERVVSIENIGIQNVYNLTAGTSHTYLANGIITHNTGGTEGADFDSLSELFDSPEGYNIRGIPNTWDEGMEHTKCGFFMPEYMNLEGYYDKDGNSDIQGALKAIKADREQVLKNTRDTSAYKRHVAEKPINTIEARMKLSGNMFPTIDLNGVLAKLELDSKYEASLFKGKFELDVDGTVLFKENPEARILYNFPHRKDDNLDAPVILYQLPIRMNDGTVPTGLYIAGTDPYNSDESTGPSVGSTFVMNKLTNQIVAEYTARPETLDDYYEQVRRLLMFYNARCLYEKSTQGMYSHFEKYRSVHLLCPEPTIIKDIISNPTPSKTLGIRMPTPIKRWGEGLIKSWLLDIQDPELMTRNLHKIRSIGLLKELVKYDPDPKKNFDRVMALMCMLYEAREEMNFKPQLEETKVFIPAHKRGHLGRFFQKPPLQEPR